MTDYGERSVRMDDIEKARAKKALKQIQQAARAGRIEFAPADKLVLVGEANVQRVLDELARILKNPHIAHAVVTDRSTIIDFAPDLKDLVGMDRACEQLSRALGTSVSRSDYIHEVAGRLPPKVE
jgi:hypothetical protein